ncbi:MAG: FAD:protein FMN transferase, partial [Calditrichaeota bacterium]
MQFEQDKNQQPDSILPSWRDKKNIHCFAHKAMATVFEIFIESEDSGGAQGAAHEAFKLLDQLENDLSRFLENSDIRRINKLEAGKETLVSPDTFECLQQSDTIFQLTKGAFDITTGVLIEQWRLPGRHL